MKRILFLLLMVLCTFSCSQQKTDKQVEKVKETNRLITGDPIVILSDSIAADSTNSMLYVKRGQLYLQNQQIAQSIQDISKAISLDNKNIEAYLTLSEIYYGMGDQENINLALTKASQIDPQDPRPYSKLAELSLLMQDYERAMVFVDRALELDNFNPQSRYVRGMVFLSRKDTISAMRNFLMARDLDAYFFEPLYQIGAIYTAQHNPLAEDFLKDALRKHPNSVVARYQLAMYLQEHGQPDAAIAHYDTLLQQHPYNSKFLYNIGYVNFIYKRDLQTALDYFNSSIQSEPEYIEAIFNKGRVLEEMGRKQEARRQYIHVLDLHSNYALAIEALNRID